MSGFDDEMDEEPIVSSLHSKEDDREVPLCGCMSVRYYQPFFDIETEDVTRRIATAAFYFRKDDSFMGLIRDRPDAYGPFWISTTLIFVVAFTSHLSSWLASWMVGGNWAYDFQSVISAASFVYGFAAGAPACLWLLLRQFEPKVKLITILCLYGYSLFVFIPWAFTCLIPSALLSWLTLLLTGIFSGLFLGRNLMPTIVEIAGQHAPTILGVVMGLQVIFSVVLKLFFF